MERMAGGVLLSVGDVRAPVATAPASRRSALTAAQRARLAAIYCDLATKMARMQTESVRAGVAQEEWQYRQLALSDVLPAVVDAAYAEVARAAKALGLGYVAVKWFGLEDELDVQDWFDAKARTGCAPWRRFSDGPIGGYAEHVGDTVWLRPYTDVPHLKHIARHEARHVWQYHNWGLGWSAADPVAERLRREADAEAWATTGAPGERR